MILYFDQSIDLRDQKIRLSNKVRDLNQKVSAIDVKLKNKSFLKNAPKHIVDSEKSAIIQYKIELKKLNSILNSIKN